VSAEPGYILPAPAWLEATRAVETHKHGEPMHCGYPAGRPVDPSEVTLIQVGLVGSWLRIHQTVSVSRTIAADLAAANGQQLESQISNEAPSRPFNLLARMCCSWSNTAPGAWTWPISSPTLQGSGSPNR
jgi:hypothetical protein